MQFRVAAKALHSNSGVAVECLSGDFKLARPDSARPLPAPLAARQARAAGSYKPIRGGCEADGAQLLIPEKLSRRSVAVIPLLMTGIEWSFDGIPLR